MVQKLKHLDLKIARHVLFPHLFKESASAFNNNKNVVFVIKSRQKQYYSLSFPNSSRPHASLSTTFFTGKTVTNPCPTLHKMRAIQYYCYLKMLRRYRRIHEHPTCDRCFHQNDQQTANTLGKNPGIRSMKI